MSAEPEAARDSLAAKLLRVRKALKRVPKRGWNDHHKYKYALAADVVKKARRLLDDEGILVVPSVAGDVSHAGTLTTVPLSYRFVDAATGESMDLPWAGVGFDKGGDKGIYKAFTGAYKYMLLGLFMVETNDDPETDATSERPQGRGAHPPRIPRERAQRIADAAIEAGLASMTDGGLFESSTTLKAYLADAGAQKIGALNVDQAEAVEQFIAAERRSKSDSN